MRKKTRQNKPGGISASIGALGVVFGDIGTSPLYALPASLVLVGGQFGSRDIYGIVSLIVWAVTMVVSVKYVMFIMRADNKGEGGILALIGLLRHKLGGGHGFMGWVLLGLVGLSLFYGDSVITPAISVLSAVEGLKVVLPAMTSLVVPISFVILLLLFMFQWRGSGRIGQVFGPIMAIWFILSGLVGLGWILQQPEALVALWPGTALGFVATHPWAGFVALGAVVLSITGAEALYADMGHFGRPAVRRVWFGLVYPALLLNYLGQGALVATHPESASSVYFLLYPEWARGIGLIFATLATVIASQAVIAGAFSLTRQAVRLGFAPPMLIKHTSQEEAGQVYINFINWLIFGFVAVLVLAFRSSVNLAAAYGMAVSGTLLIDTILFFAVARLVLGWNWGKVVLGSVIFGSIDMLFVVSSLSKVPHGGWIPLAIAAVSFTLLATWTKGIAIISRERGRREGSIRGFVIKIAHMSKLVRTPGVAVYLSGHDGHAPLAMHETVEQLHELSERVVVVTVHVLGVPHVRPGDQIVVDELGSARDGITHVTLHFGYNDSPNVPQALEHAGKVSSELADSFEEATYFLSSSRLVVERNHRMSRLRKSIFSWLYRNSASPTAYFHLPPERTIDMTSYVEL